MLYHLGLSEHVILLTVYTLKNAQHTGFARKKVQGVQTITLLESSTVGVQWSVINFSCCQVT